MLSRRAFAALVSVLLILGPVGPSSGAPGRGLAPHAPDRVLVVYRDGTPERAMLSLERSVGATHRTTILGDVRVLGIESGTVATTMKALSGQPAVLYAEPDYYFYPRGIPNDPDFGQQWALRNTGQEVNGIRGTPGADIDAVRAWDITTGSRQVVIGIIDSGVNKDHPELSANVWRNSGEIPQCPQGTHGYDFVQDRCTHQGGSHGTSVSAIAGAVGNNGSGGTGAAWKVSMMSLKIDLQLIGISLASTISEAIAWATAARKDHGVNVRVLNLSWGGGGRSETQRRAIELAGEAGILFVHAAGNAGRDIDASPDYPCSFKTWNLICVTGTNQDDELVFNYGKQTVHLGAPGTNIYTLHSYGSGTSAAAPFVSAVAALLFASGETSVSTVKGKILANADRVPSLEGKTIHGGRLNAYRALTGPAPSPAPSPTPAATASPSPSLTPTPTTSPTATPDPTSWPSTPAADEPGGSDDQTASDDETPGPGSSGGSGGSTGDLHGQGAEGSVQTPEPGAGERGGSAGPGAAAAQPGGPEGRQEGLLGRLTRAIPGRGVLSSVPGLGRLFGGDDEPRPPELRSDVNQDGSPAGYEGWGHIEEQSSGGISFLAVGLGTLLLGFAPLAVVLWRRGLLRRSIGL